MKIFYLIFGLFLNYSVCSQDNQDFDLFKTEVITLWTKGDYEQAIEQLENRKSQNNQGIEQHTIIYYLGLLNLEIDEVEKSYKSFSEGFEQNFFFSFWPDHLEKLSSHPLGVEIIQTNDRIKARFQEHSIVKYEILLPENYKANQAYPVFYFFHGNNSNLEGLKEIWQDVKLETETIVVLAQSSFARSNYAFDWIDKASGRADMLALHHTISKSMLTDTSRIIAAGFSNGGRMAIDLFLDQTFPIKGFLAFHPSKPSAMSTLAEKDSLKGKGAIISGEKDYMIRKQVEMAHAFFDFDLPLRLVVFPDHGHDYPLDFSKEVNKSVKFILGD